MRTKEEYYELVSGCEDAIRITRVSSEFFARRDGNSQEYRKYFKECQQSMAENTPESER